MRKTVRHFLKQQQVVRVFTVCYFFTSNLKKKYNISFNCGSDILTFDYIGTEQIVFQTCT